MKITRIYGIILRYMYLFRRSIDRLSDAFYWPTIDLLLWGLTSQYVMTTSNTTSPVLLIVISGLVFWIFVWRSQYEITVNLLEDLWNKNLVNIFAAPLKFSEWISAFLVLGIIKGTLSFAFAAGLAFLMYRVNVVSNGIMVLPYVALLIMSGWWVGFIVSSIILRFGTKVQMLAWSAVYVLAPFSGIYYSVSILPEWAQYISYAIPMSYIFEGIRETITTGRIDPQKILMCFVLNCLYLAIAVTLLRSSFKTVLGRGLVKVY